MPRPFARLTPQEFDARLAAATLHRRIDVVHLHHTWRPNHAIWRQYKAKGNERGVIDGMWRFHTSPKPNGNGWSDIAQHVSIDPDGGIWTGRDWNAAPASATGFNGNADAGPFMIEMIGDFDQGRDPFGGAQLDSALHVIATVQRAFGLPHTALRFHNQMTNAKTCPGNHVSRDDVLARLEALHGERGMVAEVRVEPRAEGARARGAALAEEALGAELPEKAMPQATVLRYFGAPGARPDDGDGARDLFGRGAGPGLTADDLEALRPHVVNLTDGRFGSGGTYATTAGEVDAIFDEHIPRWVEAGDQREPLRLVFWAHGGLVDEASGLAVARKHVDWWKENGVYPIYFVWETGLFDALRSVLEAVARRVPGLGARDLADRLTDPLVEAGARALGGVKVWGAMKDDAEAASAAGGGAAYVAERLARFLGGEGGQGGGQGGGPGRRVEVHAVGHSAGSIFHAHFLPLVDGLVRQAQGGAGRHSGPSVDTLQLLAPAIRVDEFERRLLPMVGGAIGRLTLYTMNRTREEADNCVRVYRKSLLYLIHHALEPERRAPVLGLELSLRGEPALRRLFELDARGNGRAELLWSTPTSQATQSTTHGGFDDDAATMNSVAARVLSAEAPRVPYHAEAGRALGDWPASDAWLRGFDLSAAGAAAGGGRALDGAFDGGFDGLDGDGAGLADRVHAHGAADAEPRTKRALCVGIDEYASSPLSGCVADAEAWAAYFRRDRAFDDVRVLRNGDATRDGILSAARKLVRDAGPGDLVVFQYAGHGTQARDFDGDETDGQDEAFVPVDYEDGALLIDDDVRAVFSELRAGANLTCFIDCCHSGTITRMLARNAAPGRGGRMRFLTLTEANQRAHARFRQSPEGRAPGGASRAGTLADESVLRWVTYSACQPTEVAFENDGHGDFTRNALAVLREAGDGGVTHQELQRRVTEAFGAGRRQSPFLDCPPHAQALRLFAPFAGGVGKTSARPDASNGAAKGAAKGASHDGNGAKGNGTAGLIRQAVRTLERAAAGLEH